MLYNCLQVYRRQTKYIKVIDVIVVNESDIKQSDLQ